MNDLPAPKPGSYWEPCLVAIPRKEPRQPRRADHNPAPRRAPFHRITHFLGAFGRLLLLVLLAGPRIWRRFTDGNPAIARQLWLQPRHAAPAGHGIAPIHDRRRAPRVATIMRVGTLSTAAGRTLCIVRNISSGGALIDGDLHLDVGESLVVELKNGCEIPGSVTWARDGSLGITFDQVVDLSEILADRHRRSGGRARMPRIELRRPVRIEVGAERFEATLVDISQQGAKLALDRPLEQGRIRIDIPGLGLRAATIRWCGDDRAGLSFDRHIPFGALAAWLTRRSDPAAVPPQTTMRA